MKIDISDKELRALVERANKASDVPSLREALVALIDALWLNNYDDRNDD